MRLQEVFAISLPCASHQPAAFCMGLPITTCSYQRLDVYSIDNPIYFVKWFLLFAAFMQIYYYQFILVGKQLYPVISSGCIQIPYPNLGVFCI